MYAINEERILKESTWMLLTKLCHYHFSKDIKNLCMHYQKWSQQKSEEKKHICKMLRFKDFLRWCLYEKKTSRLLNQIINLTFVFTTLFAKCFSAFFKNIAHPLYEQKRSCKAGWNVYMGKKRPTKARSRFYESGIPVRWENLFSHKQILIFQ